MHVRPVRYRAYVGALIGLLLVTSGALRTQSAMAFAQASNTQAKTDHDHDHDHAHDHDHDHDHDHADQPGRHVHGEITMNIALEGDTLSAELDAPAIHVVGFERAAQTDAERARLLDANTWLASGRDFLGVPRTAACAPVMQNYTPPAEGAKHANYRAVHQYRCARAESLPWIELWALRKLEGVEKVVLNLIINGRQEQVVLDGQTERVALR